MQEEISVKKSMGYSCTDIKYQWVLCFPCWSAIGGDRYPGNYHFLLTIEFMALSLNKDNIFSLCQILIFLWGTPKVYTVYCCPLTPIKYSPNGFVFQKLPLNIKTPFSCLYYK